MFSPQWSLRSHSRQNLCQGIAQYHQASQGSNDSACERCHPTIPELLIRFQFHSCIFQRLSVYTLKIYDRWQGNHPKRLEVSRVKDNFGSSFLIPFIKDNETNNSFVNLMLLYLDTGCLLFRYLFSPSSTRFHA